MAHTTTDHQTVRKRAESKGGKHAAVAESLQWGDFEFFDRSDQRAPVLLYEKDSMVSKPLGPDTVEWRTQGDSGSAS